MLTTTLMAIGLFGLFFFMMGVGFFLRGVVLKGSCGGVSKIMGDEHACGACAKKEKELCPSEDETGLLNISQLSNPHRTLKGRAADPGYQV